MTTPRKPTDPPRSDARAEHAPRRAKDEAPDPDPVDEMSEDSFPASDPPSFAHSTIAQQERRPPPDVS